MIDYKLLLKNAIKASPRKNKLLLALPDLAQALLTGIFYIYLSFALGPERYGTARSVLSVAAVSIFLSPLGQVYSLALYINKINGLSGSSENYAAPKYAHPFFLLLPITYPTALVFIYLGLGEFLSSFAPRIALTIALSFCYLEVILLVVLESIFLASRSFVRLNAMYVFPLLLKMLLVVLLHYFDCLSGTNAVLSICAAAAFTCFFYLHTLLKNEPFCVYVLGSLKTSFESCQAYCSSLKHSLQDSSGLLNLTIAYGISLLTTNIPFLLVGATLSPALTSQWANTALFSRTIFMPASSYLSRSAALTLSMPPQSRLISISKKYLLQVVICTSLVALVCLPFFLSPPSVIREYLVNRLFVKPGLLILFLLTSAIFPSVQAFRAFLSRVEYSGSLLAIEISSALTLILGFTYYSSSLTLIKSVLIVLAYNVAFCLLAMAALNGLRKTVRS